MSDKILLIAPGHNRTPRAVVKTAPGMIALDYTCVSPAVRWFTVESLAAVNDRAAVAQACKAPVAQRHTVQAVDMDMVFTCPVPDYTPELPPYMKDHIQALTEILNTRNPERQASRDLYVYELGYEIAEALAA